MRTTHELESYTDRTSSAPLVAIGLAQAARFLLVCLGGAAMLAGMVWQVSQPFGLAVAALGLLCIAAGYLSRHFMLARTGARIRIVLKEDVRDVQFAGSDTDDFWHALSTTGRVVRFDVRSSDLLVRAVVLWCLSTIVTAIAAIGWGDIAGLFAAVSTGTAALLVLAIARYRGA